MQTHSTVCPPPAPSPHSPPQPPSRLLAAYPGEVEELDGIGDGEESVAAGAGKEVNHQARPYAPLVEDEAEAKGAEALHHAEERLEAGVPAGESWREREGEREREREMESKGVREDSGTQRTERPRDSGR